MDFKRVLFLSQICCLAGAGRKGKVRFVGKDKDGKKLREKKVFDLKDLKKLPKKISVSFISDTNEVSISGGKGKNKFEQTVALPDGFDVLNQPFIRAKECGKY